MEQDTTLVSGLLRRARQGEATAFDHLFPLVYDELRGIAHRARRGWDATETLNTTALVHEAYVKLAGSDAQSWQDRAHFMAVAATAMRQILIDYARARRTAKRGGGVQRIQLQEIEAAIAGDAGFSDEKADALIVLDHSLSKLAQHSTREVRIVECRFFAGMSIRETAEALGISVATVKRGWAIAQAWLYRDLRESVES